MKIKPLMQLMLAAVSFITMENTFAQNTPAGSNDESTAINWFKSNQWKNGVQLDASPSVNTAEFYKQYSNNKQVWDKAFAFLKETDLNTISTGKHTIDGDNLFAIVTEAPSKELDQAGWESHRRYIDLQYVIKGKERIDVVDIADATVTKPYDEEHDYANYSARGTEHIAQPGTFYLFFPQDVHRPNIKVTGYDLVKKIVLKIKVAN